MKPLVSVIVPVYNGETSIASCIEAINSSDYRPIELIVVDDCSTDGSVDIIRELPCRLISLPERAGPGRARNAGAFAAKGDILFFTDADCIVFRDTISKAVKAYERHGPLAVIGGTYSDKAFDPGFFSEFQSMFVSYHETRSVSSPDYVATHAMMLDAQTFRKRGGFRERFLPILEDVEFSHRVRDNGISLFISPGVRMRHQFDFSLSGSLRNAFRKSYYWTIYSVLRGDVLADSGTASHELKINVLAWCLSAFLFTAALQFDSLFFAACATLTQFMNLFAQRRFLSYLFSTGSGTSGLLSALYYLFAYPVPVAAGSAAGLSGYLLKYRLKNIRSSESAGSSGVELTGQDMFNKGGAPGRGPDLFS